MMPEADAVVDTSFAIALLNTRDAYHQKAVDTYARCKRLLLPQPALTELAFLLERRSVNLAFVAFLERLGASYFEVVELSAADLARVAEVLRQYADTRIDFVDVCVMVLAERFELETVLTLDRRDFSLFRPRHCAAFTLLPEVL
ncbi:MAG: type II toxin-antitoxin system VapC family toxin [Geitlerinemataceae cyanobacterium]